MIIQAYAVPYTNEAALLGTGCAFALATGNYAVATTTTIIYHGQRANRALISVDKANARFKLQSSAPATACGHLFADGNYLILDDVAQMQGFRLFNEGATASCYVHVTYFAG